MRNKYKLRYLKRKETSVIGFTMPVELCELGYQDKLFNAEVKIGIGSTPDRIVYTDNPNGDMKSQIVSKNKETQQEKYAISAPKMAEAWIGEPFSLEIVADKLIYTRLNEDRFKGQTDAMNVLNTEYEKTSQEMQEKFTKVTYDGFKRIIWTNYLSLAKDNRILHIKALKIAYHKTYYDIKQFKILRDRMKRLEQVDEKFLKTKADMIAAVKLSNLAYEKYLFFSRLDRRRLNYLNGLNQELIAVIMSDVAQGDFQSSKIYAGMIGKTTQFVNFEIKKIMSQMIKKSSRPVIRNNTIIIISEKETGILPYEETSSEMKSKVSKLDYDIIQTINKSYMSELSLDGQEAIKNAHDHCYYGLSTAEYRSRLERLKEIDSNPLSKRFVNKYMLNMSEQDMEIYLAIYFPKSNVNLIKSSQITQYVRAFKEQFGKDGTILSDKDMAHCINIKVSDLKRIKKEIIGNQNLKNIAKESEKK